jgi:hypothetical protein
MSDGIVDLNAERSKRERPDPEFIMKDDFGREMFRFSLSYEMDGKQWATSVWAYDFEDAQKRVDGMRATLTLDGQLFTSVLL